MFMWLNRVEWPGKENQAAQPKGYVYIIFESEKQVRELLNACTIQDGNDANSGNYYFKISSKRIKAKEVCIKIYIQYIEKRKCKYILLTDNNNPLVFF